ncbi:hypothetical protein KP509_22G048100 [Ceratopteris richardii]|nr:hypothetical protein KP509_1Z313300 [Ceratopteris richardii]KAH7307148.1 hypothetical protein KP509_22G048100 [Ceratopteris richardii]
MLQHDILPNGITYTSILRACGVTQDIFLGKKVHHEIVILGLLENDIILGTALIDMYSKCGALHEAQAVLDDLPRRDVISWSALITGYVQKGDGKEALSCYDCMQSDRISPNAFVYSCILKACGITQDIGKGKAIHDEITSSQIFEKDVVLGTALVDMYAKCGAIDKAQEVFERAPLRNVASWSALIGGYVRHGKEERAFICFEQMQSEGIAPNAVTYACVLKACGTKGAIDRGIQIHDEISHQGLLKQSPMLGICLIDMYAKCGFFNRAKQVLNEFLIQSAVPWNALIGEYVHQGKGNEAVDCYLQMQSRGFSPDAITYICVLKACGITQAYKTGVQIHHEISRQGILRENVILGNALINMYAEWGMLLYAEQMLDEIPTRNNVSWNAIISAYAQHGESEKAWKCFLNMQHEGFSPNIVSWNTLIMGYALEGLAEKAFAGLLQMQCEGIIPDPITFVCILNACSHAGLVDEGQLYFKIMSELFGIPPDIEHFICMVDLFGRAGHLVKAMAITCGMPFLDHLPVWSALLAACQKWMNVNLGRLVFGYAVQLSKNDASVYVSMKKIFAAAGMHEELLAV